jgi:outer membrane lipoprotein-sorting protein
LRIRTGIPGLIGYLGTLSLFAMAVALCASLPKQPRVGSLTENTLFSHMDSEARRVRTVSAELAYTTVTVLVDARSTENGMLYYRKGRRPEVRIEFTGPDAKTILFRKGTAEIYYPKINQIQEYDLSRHQNLLQQFLLLGFGTETSQLESSYSLHYLGEKKLEDQITYLLELTPLSKDVAAQLKKVDLWISGQSWMPVQQQFFEASGDYLIARYSNMKVNRPISPSSFKITAPGAERIKMD